MGCDVLVILGSWTNSSNKRLAHGDRSMTCISRLLHDYSQNKNPQVTVRKSGKQLVYIRFVVVRKEGEHETNQCGSNVLIHLSTGKGSTVYGTSKSHHLACDKSKLIKSSIFKRQTALSWDAKSNECEVYRVVWSGHLRKLCQSGSLAYWLGYSACILALLVCISRPARDVHS